MKAPGKGAFLLRGGRLMHANQGKQSAQKIGTEFMSFRAEKLFPEPCHTNIWAQVWRFSKESQRVNTALAQRKFPGKILNSESSAKLANLMLIGRFCLSIMTLAD